VPSKVLGALPEKAVSTRLRGTLRAVRALLVLLLDCSTDPEDPWKDSPLLKEEKVFDCSTDPEDPWKDSPLMKEEKVFDCSTDPEDPWKSRP
jgi:hypothetical protein